MRHRDGTKSGQAEGLDAFLAATALTLVIGKDKPIRVRDIVDASNAYCRIRLESGLGGSEFPNGVIMEGGRPAAWISYNGKVWAEDPCTHSYGAGATHTPLYDPYASDRALEDQAVDDIMDDVVLLAHETHKALAIGERNPLRREQELYCTEIYDRIAARARSAGIGPTRLLDRATRRLDKEHPTSPIVQVPEFLRDHFDRIAA